MMKYSVLIFAIVVLAVQCFDAKLLEKPDFKTHAKNDNHEGHKHDGDDYTSPYQGDDYYLGHYYGKNLLGGHYHGGSYYMGHHHGQGPDYIGFRHGSGYFMNPHTMVFNNKNGAQVRYFHQKKE